MVLCRLCYLEINGESLKNIFDEKLDPPIWKIIFELANLTIIETDPYTKAVCCDCFNDLLKYHIFRKTILENDKKFKEICNDISGDCPTIKMEIEDEDYDLIDEKIDIEEYEVNIDKDLFEPTDNDDDDDNSRLDIDDKNSIEKIDVQTNDRKIDHATFKVKNEHECLNNEEIEKSTKSTPSNIIPKRSQNVYEKEIKQFNAWMKEIGSEGINEEVILAYFQNYRNKYAATSLRTKYSMLKATLKVYKNIDISNFGTVTSFLKDQSKSYKAKKSKVLGRKHIEEFLKNAPDSVHLMHKVVALYSYWVVLIMGISGGCRCQELVNMTINDIHDKGTYLHVIIPDARTNTPRSFTIMKEVYPIDPIVLCKKYMSLRPDNVTHSRFFLNYKNYTCTVQPVGINTVSKIPSKVAHYLKLPESESYTGHNLKRSSSMLLN